MLIDFDPAKDARDLDKHGLSLALATELDWDDALVWIDERHRREVKHYVESSGEGFD